MALLTAGSIALADQSRPSGGIRGRVVADLADADQPLGNARIQLGPVQGGEPVFTDRFGRFEFRALTAGKYFLTVEKAGFARTRYGGASATDAGAPITVGGGLVDGIEVRMPKGAAVYGRVTDEFGDPLVAATVSATPIERVGTSLRLASPAAPPFETDDLGAYRIGGLAAGDYVVVVNGARAGSVYYPGTPALTSATRTTLHVGEEAGPIDVRVGLTQPASATMTVTGLPASGLATASIVVVPAHDEAAFGGRRMPFAARGGGPMRMTQLLDPGDWIALARFQDLGALVHFTLQPGDSAEVPVALDKTSRITGRVVFDGKPGANPTDLRLDVRGSGWDASVPPRLLLPTMAVPAPDGTFVMTGVLGTITLDVVVPPAGWLVQSIVAGDHDLLHDAATFAGGAMLDGVRVLLSDRVARFGGQAIDERGRPAVGCHVVVLPDRPLLDPASPALRLTRADQNGMFTVADLPVGDFLIAAVRQLDVAEWRTRPVLEQLRARGIRYALSGQSPASVTIPCGS